MITCPEEYISSSCKTKKKFVYNIKIQEWPKYEIMRSQTSSQEGSPL